MQSDLRCCATCGFLANRNKNTGIFEIATSDQRERGHFKTDTNDGGVARCSKNIGDLPQESLAAIKRLTNGVHADNANSGAIKEVIQRERLECGEWIQFNPLMSPKEHEDMNLVEKIQSRAQQWRDEDLRWRREVEQSLERRHIEAATRAEAAVAAASVKASVQAESHARSVKQSQRVTWVIAGLAVIASIASASAAWVTIADRVKERQKANVVIPHASHQPTSP